MRSSRRRRRTTTSTLSFACMASDLASHPSRQGKVARMTMSEAGKAGEGRCGERGRVGGGRVNARRAEVVEPMTPGRALDLGCGEGADAMWLAEHGWHVTAVDISQTALDRAAVDAA